MNLNTIRAMYKALLALTSGEKTRSKLLLAARVKDKEATQEALKQLLNGGFMTEREAFTINPGRKPRYYKITDAGREELERIKREYK